MEHLIPKPKLKNGPQILLQAVLMLKESNRDKFKLSQGTVMQNQFCFTLLMVLYRRRFGL